MISLISSEPQLFFTTPDINWGPLLPVIVVLGGAVIGVLLEAFVPARARRVTSIVWSLLVVGTAFVFASTEWVVALGDPSTVGEFVDDTLTVAVQVIVTVVGFLSILVLADRSELRDGAMAAQPSDRPGSGEEALSLAKHYQRSEFFPLMLFSMGGMMLFPATDSLLTMFVALEVMSLPLYILVASARRHRDISQEAAIKYFILGSFASAFFLMGSAFMYGYSGGSLHLGDIAAAIPAVPGMDMMMLIGVFFIMVGLLFKVAVFPFHEWTPDVYTGAPTPITGFMAAGVKVAAFGALLRFYVSVAGHLRWDFSLILAILAAATIIFGTFGGLVQRNIKRLLAYSSIAHAGFLMIGVLALVPGSAGSTAFYLLSYAIATIGSFAIIGLIRTQSPGGAIGGEATQVTQWAGLAKRSPSLAIAMLIFLMSFAGIPLTSGFIGKFVVFANGIQGGLGWLVAIGLLASVVTAAVYFRVVQVMFFREPAEGVTVVRSEGTAAVAITIAAITTVLLGIFPGPVLDFFNQIVILIP